MAVGWVTALKLVPWGDVLEATPQILQAAKKLLGSTRQGTSPVFVVDVRAMQPHPRSPFSCSNCASGWRAWSRNSRNLPS